MFYGIMSRMMKMNMKDSSDYKLLDRKVVDVLLGLRERNTFFRALTFWAGFKSTKVEYEVQERKIGTTKWSFRSLIRYAISNVTSFSTIPLQMVTVLGIISILFSVVLAIQTLIRFLMGKSVEGFTTVILLILIIGGFIKGDVQVGELYANAARVEGDVHVVDAAKIGVGTVIVGNVFAGSAVIAGAVKGDIDVQGPVIVDSTAVIMGNIKSKSVQINNGAVIEGMCSQCYSEIDVKSFFE